MLSLLVVALAAASAPRPVTLEEARSLAEKVALDVQLAEKKIGISSAEVEVAGALQNPTVTVQTARETARIGTSLSVPLPLFGQRGMVVDAARADLRTVELEAVAVRRDSRWSATLAWIDLWEAEHRAALLQRAAEEADRLVTIAKQRFDAGAAPRVDVVRATADRARARAEASAAGSAIQSAASRMIVWIGPGAEEARTSGDPAFTHVLPKLADLERKVADHHPLLARDRAEQAAAGAHIEAEERLRWPIINGQLSVNQLDPTLPATDIIFGLGFEVPILSLRGGAIARAQAQQALAETALGADARRLSSQITDAYRRAEGGSARVAAFESEVLPSTEEARGMTEDGYQDGRIDLARLLEAQHALIEARIAHAEAVAAWSRAMADLERAAGMDLERSGGDAP